MAQLERARATALLFVYVHPLVQVLAARATLPEPSITEGEALALVRFCRRFGGQLAARGDGKLVPAEPQGAGADP